MMNKQIRRDLILKNGLQDMQKKPKFQRQEYEGLKIFLIRKTQDFL